jgi:hypothetical protein
MPAFYEFKGDDWADIANAFRDFNDIHPESVECIKLSKTWAADGTHVWKLVNEKLSIEIKNDSLRNLVSRYEDAVEIATAPCEWSPLHWCMVHNPTHNT